MKLIVVTAPENKPEDAQHIQELFIAGLESLHLRKPDLSQNDFEKIVKQLPPSLYKKIVIHSHYKLIEKYNLKGIHLTAWFMREAGLSEVKKIITTAHQRRLSVSGSFHSIEDLENLQLKLDYVFLGPVFDSISKEGYNAKININDAAVFLQKRKGFEVFAIGGISKNNINNIKTAGFDGAVLLGSIWNGEDPSDNFKEIQKQITA
ncbi:MAG TPA: thiamine phosphate synthase [Cyclobacteriaceae bacterium]